MSELVKQFGPWLALVIFFVWQSWLRENRLGTQLDEVHKFIRETLAGVVERNTRAMVVWTGVLKDKPCLADDPDALDANGDNGHK